MGAAIISAMDAGGVAAGAGEDQERAVDVSDGHPLRLGEIFQEVVVCHGGFDSGPVMLRPVA